MTVFGELFSGRMFGEAVGDLEAVTDAEIVDRQDVRASELEDQQHFDCPAADSADGRQPLDDFIVGEFVDLAGGRNHPVEALGGDVLNGQNLRA